MPDFMGMREMRGDPLVGEADKWEEYISAAFAHTVPEVTCVTFKIAFPTASKPVAFKCDDGRDWVVKAQFARRGVASDAALAVIATSTGAPMPATCRAIVNPVLVDAEPQLQNLWGAGPMLAGRWHASLWIDGVHSNGDKRDNSVRPSAENAERFGRLALLYAWCGMGDRQFVYEDDPPHLVHVVDMGHTLPGHNGWSCMTLDSHVPSATLPGDLWKASGFDRSMAESVLSGISDPINVIARAAARPLDHWGDLSMPDRVSLAHYLSRQFDALQATVTAL